MTRNHQQKEVLDGAAAWQPQHKGFLLCGGPGCRRFSLAHPWLRKDGVFLDGGWLCSAECLQAAAVAALHAKASCERLPMPRLPRMPFRLHLLQRGAITEAVLEQAQRYGRAHSLSLSEALLELGSVREEQLAAAHAAENGCAFFALPAAAMPVSLQLPGELARHFGAATVHATQDRVLVGFVHRLDRILLEAVEQLFGRRAEGCFLAASRYQARLAADRDPGGPATVPTTLRAAAAVHASRAEAGVLLRELALREGAEWIRAGYLRNAVWFRWWRSKQAHGDLLLHLSGEQGSKTAAIPNAVPQTGSLARVASPKWEQKKVRVL